jgi:thioester reductase-like protein
MSVPTGHRIDESALAARIATLAMQFVRAPERSPDPSMSFTDLGLDSLGTIELAAAIEEDLGIDVPLDLVADSTDARTLAACLTHRRGSAEDPHEIVRDAILPDDVRPPARSASRRIRGGSLLEARSVLLTGATGFLGGWLTAELLRRSDTRLICLVRPGRRPAGERLQARLVECGVDPKTVTDRVTVAEGDLTQPSLGLSSNAFSRLASASDAVCHVGAAVNWVHTYRGLRSANVTATRELLRLACLQGHPFHFVSSISVCYSTTGPAVVDETYEPLPHLSGIHLGYAQTKAVSEALVLEARRRGLPATIYRPSLISGHSATADFNADDLLSLLIKGCVAMGCAPDLDWTLDALPVDVVAARILDLSRARGTFHLSHPRPRHWRECVLWMRLYGYSLSLLPYHAWLQRLEADLEDARRTGRRHPLEPLERLMFERPDGGRGFTIPELLEDTRRSRATCARTEKAFARLRCPDLDAGLLERYFERFISAGHLPPPDRTLDHAGRSMAPGSQRASLTPAFDCRFFSRALAGRDGVRVVAATRHGSGSAQSIVSELTAWRSPRPTGIFRYTLDLDEGGTLRRRDAVLKVKARDADAIAVGEALSGLCDGQLGIAYRRWKDRIGLTEGHRREAAIYAQTDHRFTSHTPALIGTISDDREGLWAVVLEHISDAVLLDSTETPRAWNGRAIDAAILGLSSLQSIWYGRRDELSRQPWIGWIQSAAGAADMIDLWDALANHARPSFCAWSDPSLAGIHRRLIARTAQWWQDLESQTPTLIHNDFNPRNVCLRRASSGLRLCAFDWELATLGAPQRDLAEFLCFVLTASADDDEIDHWIERHRIALEAETSTAIDPLLWRKGFAAALYDVLVSRLSMYALIHRVRRQSFLLRVVGTWRRLYERFPLVEEA